MLNLTEISQYYKIESLSAESLVLFIVLDVCSGLANTPGADPHAVFKGGKRMRE